MSTRLFSRSAISLRLCLRHFTHHVSLQRQITRNNVKEKNNTNSNPNSFKPSLLGTKEPPNNVHKTDTRTWSEKLKYFFSVESNVKTREYLIKEYQKSYWQGFNELRIQGEKLWEANEEVIKADKALYMPNINARSLLKTNIDTMNLLRDKTTLLAVFFNQFGEIQVKSFIEPFLTEFSTRPKIQLMQLNIETNVLKSFILKLFIPNIRRATPQSLHKTYILLLRNDQFLREALNIYNAYRGYVFVIDADCKIRWFAHGYATTKEIETMSKIINDLDKCKKNI
ncbi:ATP10 protein [Glomus cerebriforme]|uniref:ATP10 protein n=1 Tax=Glomus cerebriforme TaxID=658196 RepID=A0A397TQ82_9GLOM|nr:ATP10 protein [Glomus cerebriforme]